MQGNVFLVILLTNDILIIYFSVIVKSLIIEGKTYEWKRPASCPACKGIRLWGHGFIGRYFHGFTEKVWVKRYRCTDCKAVHTMRPLGYWKGFQYSRSSILRSFLYKIRGNKWIRSIPRQNQQYWLKGLIFQSSVCSNVAILTVEVVKQLIIRFIIPPSHSKQSECLRL